MKSSLVLLFILALALTSCSSFSKAGRQRHSYEKYLRKSSVARVKQRSLFHGSKPSMPMTPMPTEPSDSSASGPQAVPSEASSASESPSA